MFKNKATVEVKGADDRIHMYVCPTETPLGEAYDVLTAIRGYVLDQINAQNEAEKPKEEEKSIECDSCAEEKEEEK